MEMLKRLWKDERGLELSEYAVMAALVIIVAIGIIGLLGDAIIAKFTELKDAIGGEAG